MIGRDRAEVPGRGRWATPAPLAACVTPDAPLPLEDGLPILADVLAHLRDLHAADTAHGELGPETVVVRTGPGGEPTAGLAPLPGGRPAGPGFLAPERETGAPATPVADVWSAGALAVFLFTGRPPAKESFLLAAPGLPLRLALIVDRMLAEQPDRRPSVDRALAEVEALRAIVAPAGPPEARDDPPPGEPSGGAGGGWLSGLFRKKAPARPAAPDRPRPASNRSLDLLGLEELEPLPRSPVPPLPPDRLRAAVQATLAEATRVDDLPTFPGVALEVVELARRPDIGANELVRLLNRDPALTARVLRIANSAYLSRGIEITSTRDAVTRLGMVEVARIAATAATRSLFVNDTLRAVPAAAGAAHRVWIHSLTSALSASWLAMECRFDPERAFLAGLLHDIGKVVALRAFVRVVTDRVVPDLDPEGMVDPLLEATHVFLGERTTRAWALPSMVIQTCARHHHPEAALERGPELHLVRVVSALASLRLDPGWSPDRLEELRVSAAVLNLDRFRVRATATQVRGFQERAGQLAQASL